MGAVTSASLQRTSQAHQATARWEGRVSRGGSCPAQPQLRAQDQLRQRLPTHLLAVRAGKVVRCCLQMMLQGFWRGVLIYTLHTPECGEKGQSLRTRLPAANPPRQADPRSSFTHCLPG